MRSALPILVLLSLCVPAAAQRSARGSAEGAVNPAQSVARELRAEWEVAELKLTREAVDDTSFKPKLKGAAVEALETFISGQEKLLKRVEQSPDLASKARTQRVKMQAVFLRRMAVVYDDPRLRQELTTCVRALNREMDDMAASAGTLFARLEQVGLTAEQKQKLKPVVEDASRRVREAVEKSKTKSTRDRAVRDEVVEKFKESRKTVKQHLTPEQREKLKQKLAAEG